MAAWRAGTITPCGGPRKRRRSQPNQMAVKTSARPATSQTAFSFGGAMPIAMRRPPPATHTTASGRYSQPMSHGPILVQLRPYAQKPSAVGMRYEMYKKIVQAVMMVEYTGV